MYSLRSKAALFAVGAAALSLAGPASAQTTGNFMLKDGDRVVFYGDSITDQRQYTIAVEDYVVTRFPKMNVSFVHSGWGGDRVTGGGGGPIDVRLQRDVFAYRPTVMTVMLGMNDGGYRSFDQGIFNTYSTGLANIVDKVTKTMPGIRMTLIQPSPYDDVTYEPKFPGGYNAVLVRYGDYVKELAAKTGQTAADLNGPVVSMLQKAKSIDAANAQKIIPDRVHPGAAGHLIMAEALLKAWNAPAIVTDVEIDAAGGKAVRAVNTRVTDVKGGESVSWTQLDEALPMPINLSDPIVALAVKSSDVIDALDRQPLKVTGLPGKAYTLKIDGMEVGSYTAAQLAQGVNLATEPTPMLQQAKAVQALTRKRSDLHNTRWRSIQVPLGEYKSAAMQQAVPQLVAAIDVEVANLAAEQRKAAQPVPHKFELTAAAPPPTGPNLALNKKYEVSDPNKYNWGIGGLTDGSWEANSTHAFATGDTATFPKTATIDLGEARKIGHVVMGVPGFGSTKTVKISVSPDGQNFTEVGTAVFSLRREEKRQFSFTPVNARYVRVTYVDHYDENVGYTPTFAFATEVEVYAAAE